MLENKDDSNELLDRAASGNDAALAKLFSKYQSQLKQAILIRMDRHLQRRERESDILQESFLAAARDLPRYNKERRVPPYIWLRGIVQQRLVDACRHHGRDKRNARREVSLHGALPFADSVSLASHLSGDLSSPSSAATKAEFQQILQTVLAEMEPLDREIIALRHFEHLKNVDVAEILDMDESTTSSRYLRALKKLKDALVQYPEFFAGL
ncbi:sigma-70 family RNA polymerase sigma factor [bacterium]|nr:sigma-70 family RNA polymerase sigma factor [bacterium]